MKRGSVALAVLTFYCAPIFLAVLAPLFLPEKLSNVALGALVPGGIGIALVALAGEDGHAFGWVALACGIGSALTFAVLVILSKRLLHVGRRAADGGLLGLPRGSDRARSGALLRRAISCPTTPASGLPCSCSASSSPGSRRSSTPVLLRHVTAQAAGILTFLEPVAAVFLAWVFLDESLAPQAIVGGLLVLLAGIAVVVLEPTESRVSEAVAGVGSLDP